MMLDEINRIREMAGLVVQRKAIQKKAKPSSTPAPVEMNTTLVLLRPLAKDHIPTKKIQDQSPPTEVRARWFANRKRELSNAIQDGSKPCRESHVEEKKHDRGVPVEQDTFAAASVRDTQKFVDT